ncbi:hypothetical protein FHS32_004948 [Streptomyces albaduncus]|uniref:Uncharacterized protein n=1 Tax=Streptomyces griseoloalbus TaxID=67303 RepID=A0A7W8BU47_9ACTN|nr:hypothetical protein [Streptomyces albaduncus]
MGRGMCGTPRPTPLAERRRPRILAVLEKDPDRL